MEISKRTLEQLVQDAQSQKSCVHAVTLASGAQKSAVDTFAAATHVAASEASGSHGTRRIYAFSAKHVQDSINVHSEAQAVKQNLKLKRWWKNFELDCFAMPTFDSFVDSIRVRGATGERSGARRVLARNGAGFVRHQVCRRVFPRAHDESKRLRSSV